MLEFVYKLKEVSSTTPIFWFRPEDLITNDNQPSTAAAGTQLDEWIKADYSSNCLLIVDAGRHFDDVRRIEKLKNFAGTILLIARSAYDARQIVGPRHIFE